MNKPRNIVTGATGKTGSVMVTELLKAGYPVRATVHREDDRSARLRAIGSPLSPGRTDLNALEAKVGGFDLTN